VRKNLNVVSNGLKKKKKRGRGRRKKVDTKPRRPKIGNFRKLPEKKCVGKWPVVTNRGFQSTDIPHRKKRREKDFKRLDAHPAVRKDLGELKEKNQKKIETEEKCAMTQLAEEETKAKKIQTRKCCLRGKKRTRK